MIADLLLGEKAIPKGSEENYEQEKREDMDRWDRYQLTCEAIAHQEAVAWLENLAQGLVSPCPN